MYARSQPVACDRFQGGQEQGGALIFPTFRVVCRNMPRANGSTARFQFENIIR